MNRPKLRSGVRCFLGLGLLVAMISGEPSAEARQAVFVGAAPGGMGRIARTDEPPVTGQQLERYAKFLSLTPEQRKSADELLDAMKSEYVKASAERKEAMDAMRAEFEESQDSSVILKGAPKVMSAFRARRTELETTFLEDLKLTLTDEQAGLWPSLERMRRRDQAGDGAMVSGESIDLTRVVEELTLPPEALDQTKPLLERYEEDFDRALTERNEANEDQRAVFAGGSRPAPQDMMQLMNDAKKASLKVRDVNRSYARQIQGALPEEYASKFESKYRSLVNPNIYGASYATKSLDAALGLDDLTAEQKASLKQLRDAYSQEVEPLNEKWAEAIATDESDPSSATMGMFGGVGGARMIIREGPGAEEAENIVSKAASARKDLDSRYLDRARALLTPKQQERLPTKKQAKADEEEEGVPADAIMIEVHETSDGEHEPERTVRVSSPVPPPSGGAPAGEGGGSPPPPPTAPRPR